MRISHRHIVAFLLLAVVLSIPARAAVVSPEIASFAHQLDLAPGFKGGSAIATNGFVYLVVWGDGRARNRCGLYAARVTRAGEVLDRVGIKISDDCEIQGQPYVAWTGDSFLVVWRGLNDLVAQRIGANGELLHAEPFTVLTRYSYRATAFAASRSGVVVALRDPSGLLFVSRDGSPLRQVELLQHAGLRVAVASDGLNYAAVSFAIDTRGNGRLILSAISSSGVLNFANATIVPLGGGYRTYDVEGFQMSGLAVVGDGNGYRAYWVEYKPDYISGLHQSRVRGASFDAAGAPVSGPFTVHEGRPFTMTSPVVTVVSPGMDFVTWNSNPDGSFPSNWSVVWTYAKRISGSVVLDPSPLVIAESPTFGALTANDQTALVSVADALRLKIVDVRPAGEPRMIADVPVSISAPEQTSPAAATGARSTVAVWAEKVSARRPARVMSGELRPGMTSPSEGVEVSPSLIDQVEPAIASAGDRFLVVFSEDYKSVRAVLVGRSGEPLGLPAVTFPGMRRSPAAVWNGGSFLVAAEGEGGIRFARVSRDGALLDPEPGLMGGFYARSPALACDGTYTLLAWQDGHVRDGCGPAICFPGPRASINWLFLNQRGEVVTPIQTRGGVRSQYYTRPSVAWNGTQYLLTFLEEKFEPSRATVLAIRIAPDLSLLDPAPRTIGPGPARDASPAVAGLTDGFVVSWQRASQCGTEQPPCFDIAAARLHNDGSVTAPVIIPSVPAGLRLALVPTSDNSVAVLWQRLSPEKTYGNVYRIFHRLVSFVERRRGVRRGVTAAAAKATGTDSHSESRSPERSSRGVQVDQ